VNRRIALKLAAASLATYATSDSARAEADNWPTRAITMFVPASAGSGTDILARELALRLGAALKQSIVIDNKPGASGILGTQAAVRAAPDGYSLLYTNGTNMVMAPALLKSMPYDVQKDLAPVAQTVTGGVFLLVNPELPVRNLQELVALLKANPGQYTYGSWAVGSSGHLTMEWLKRQAGLQLNHIPYKQVSQLITELSTGVLKIGWTDPSSALPFIDAGKLRPIAVSGGVRLPRTPNIPTMGEQGYPFESVGWFGLFAPAGTPPAIITRLNDEVQRIQAQPEMIARIAAFNVTPSALHTPEQFRQVVAADLQTWKKIVADAGITVDS
jgi:tripartite-type tricarboxylate transporter receptor subunit TctC